MKIALVSPTPVPPTFGGMDRLLQGLLSALRERHETDLITIPFDERSREGVLRGYYDFYHLDLGGYDLAITYKAPAYMIRHPRQVCYLSHRVRVFYDLYEPGDAEHGRMRDLIRYLDGWALDKQRLPFLFTVGETVSRRLMKYGGIESIPVHHPSTYQPIEPKRGEYFLSVGRLHPWKRIDLIVRAFLKSKADCPLVIVGEGPQEAELRDLATGDPRIQFEGLVSDNRLAEIYSRALVTVFPPISEDMGLITFESFLSGKPILTTSDAGEPPLIVKEGETGFVCEPTPESMAERMDWIWAHRNDVVAMQNNCREWMKQVTWTRLVDRLLDAGEKIEAMRVKSPAIHVNGRAAPPEPAREPKIELLVTDNQIIDPPLGGGRVRILELYRHMPEDFNTTYIGAFDYPGPTARDQQLAPNFREILTPLTAPHFKAHEFWNRLTSGDATIDVTMPLLGNFTPRYRRLVEKHLPMADILICAHPWMFPFLPGEPAKPRVYDSQNCEALLKAPLLRRTVAGRYLAKRVRETERLAVEGSQLILACSPDDAAAFAREFAADPERIIEIPNGVDCAAIRPANPRERAEARTRIGIGDLTFALFTGSNYVPNLEGAAFIIEQLAPAFPQIVFGIAGGVGPMYRTEYPAREIPANVRIYGFVERPMLLDLYAAADLALNPMSQGSGTNIKMLDYMAAGLPILTTAKGARGIGGRSGEHWIEAPLNAQAAELKVLLENPDRRRKLGDAARKLAETKYDWAHIAERLAERLRKLAESKAAQLASA